MQADPLQQLKDVHLPPDPSWWPPAPGWWLLATMAVVTIAWLTRVLRKRYRERQPFASGLRLHKQLRLALNNGEISIVDYLHSANSLLKRVFIHGQHDRSIAALTGERWLQHLDSFVIGAPFSEGPGALLSERRFATKLLDSDAAELNALQRAIDDVLQAAGNQRRDDDARLSHD
ncbi:MAG: DUF4381 domain-containing protein [Pseudomonadales bacterium]